MTKLYEDYLNYLEELTKWKTKVSKLPQDEIDKIKSKIKSAKTPKELDYWKSKVQRPLTSGGLEKIKGAGISKSAEEFRKGVDKGSINILKKSNATRIKSILPPSTYPSFFKKNHSTHHDPITWKGGSTGKTFNVKNRGDWKKLKPYIDRHEADEARYSDKLRKKYKSMPTVNQLIRKDGIEVGQHKSLGVVKNEKKLTDYANKLYGDAEGLRGFRKYSGEYDTVDKMSKKDIGKIDKESAKKGISHLRSVILKAHKGNRKSAIGDLKALNKIKKYRKAGLLGIAGATVGLAATAAHSEYKKHKELKEFSKKRDEVLKKKEEK